jgi:transportin-1
MIMRKRGLDPLFPEKDFVVCALDLLSHIAESIGTSIESLVKNSNVLPLLFECMKDETDEVRQSAFALLGDFAKCCIGHLKPHLTWYLPVAAQNFLPNKLLVCNNASWAVGEIAVQIGKDMEPFVDMLLQHLIPFINSTSIGPNLLQNAAITMGRIGLVCPQRVAKQLHLFAERWCKLLASILENVQYPENNIEREHAFHGLAAVTAANPTAMLQHFNVLCHAVASWQRPRPEMVNALGKLLHQFKSWLKDKWPQTLATVHPQIRATLIKAFKL